MPWLREVLALCHNLRSLSREDRSLFDEGISLFGEVLSSFREGLSLLGEAFSSIGEVLSVMLRVGTPFREDAGGAPPVVSSFLGVGSTELERVRRVTADVAEKKQEPVGTSTRRRK